MRTAWEVHGTGNENDALFRTAEYIATGYFKLYRQQGKPPQDTLSVLRNGNSCIKKAVFTGVCL
jgi:hypothetical protein